MTVATVNTVFSYTIAASLIRPGQFVVEERRPGQSFATVLMNKAGQIRYFASRSSARKAITRALRPVGDRHR